MQNSKGASVNNSSLFDLKAELYKKQEEFRKTKLYNELRGTSHRPKKKQSIWDVKNNGVASRSAKDVEANANEENSLSKSRRALEAKALLYEKLQKGTSKLGDEEKSLFLVNFDQKPKECVQQSETDFKAETAIDAHEKCDENTEDIPPSSYEEQWVDYIDQFGRSRRCMRKDVPENVTLDTESERNKKVDPMKMLLVSEDMRREHQRQLWEEEEREAMNNPVGDIHYQNVLFDEARSHGVGYYGFSKDEGERAKQEEMLNEMRDQTVKNRDARENILQKRKAKMAERLAKVRERKKLKIDEREESIVETGKEKLEIDRSLEIEKKLAEIEAEHSRKQHIRPWDKDKKSNLSSSESVPKLSQADWINKRRDERNWEFAPPCTTYISDDIDKNLQNKNQSNRQNVKLNSHNPKAPDSTPFYQDFSLDDIPLPDTDPSCASGSGATVDHVDSKVCPTVNQFQPDIIENETMLLNQKNFSEIDVLVKNDNSNEKYTGNNVQDFQTILSQQLTFFKNKS